MKQIIVAQVQTKITINQAVQVRVPEAVQTALIEGVLIQNQVVAINQIIVVVLIIILTEVAEARHEATIILIKEAAEVRHEATIILIKEAAEVRHVAVIIQAEVVEVRHEAVIIQAEVVEVRHAVVRRVLLVLDEDKYSKAS